MDVNAIASSGKSILEIAKEIAEMVNRAMQAPNVVYRVRLYLEVARASVAALGSERQQILSDVRKCDLSAKSDVKSLWERLDRYLHEDNIRPHLQTAIHQLERCSSEIQQKSDDAWWRAPNKQAAAQAFSATLAELRSLLHQLTSNFYPGGSGMGVQTLGAIYKYISKVYQQQKSDAIAPFASEEDYEELARLARQAVRDKSHEEWFKTAAEIDALITELELAFSIKTPVNQKPA